MFIDLHLCAENMEDTQWAEGVFATARDGGLDGIVLTGNDVAIDAATLKDMADHHGIHLFVAVQVPTDAGTVLLYPSETGEDYFNHKWQIDPDEGVYPYEEIRLFCQERRWAIVAAQPYQANHGMQDRIYEIEGLHGVEVITQNVGSLARDLAIEAAVARNLSTMAASGMSSNKPYEVGSMTALLGNTNSQSGLVDLLINGKSWIFGAVSKPTKHSKDSSSRRKRSRRGGKRRKSHSNQGE